jgi:hypothetical protein
LLSLGFVFEDGADSAQIGKSDLMEALSTGEKKALYVLNIIFEIEARKKAAQETLLIVDDIADSFDYRNKYAIIQYLKDIAEEPQFKSCFKQIILTHNFDFFRTINSRFVKYTNCFMVSKSSVGIVLNKAAGIQNVFTNDWKLHFSTDNKKKVASIPFIRNLIEYTKGENDPDYIKLTSLLHWKTDSDSITNHDLDCIYNKLFSETINSADSNKPVFDIIHEQASDCLNAADGINLENKIVLSIAIRLIAEKFMANKIADPAFVSAIDSHQTTRLLGKFMEKFPTEVGSIKTIRQVVLMTPENIHLNSFMYEPILDMSDDHLRKLYQDVQVLA